MSEERSQLVGLADPADALPAMQASVIRAEFALDAHTILGNIRCPGAPRRLVDLLNSIEDPFFLLRDGEIEEAASSSRPFSTVHLDRSAILFAVPITAPPPGDASETVAKKPIAATLALPGYEISGSLYFPLETDPSAARLLPSRDFFPVTDAEITALDGGAPARRERVVVVNLKRVLLYALNDGLAQRSSGSSTPSSRPQRSTPPNRTRRNSSA